jgi:RNase P subunit RPR2
MAIVVGVDQSAVKRITCKNCASILEYKPSEVRNLWSGTDYGGGPDGADGFTCPSCGADVITKRW